MMVFLSSFLSKSGGGDVLKKKERNFFFAKKKKKRRQNRVLLRRQRRGLAFLCPPSQKPREGVVCKRARLLRVRWWWERPRFVSL